LIEEMGSARALDVNFLRARITRKAASLEVEIFGAARKVDQFLKVSARRGASIRALSAIGA
jgi:hypothetical protein